MARQLGGDRGGCARAASQRTRPSATGVRCRDRLRRAADFVETRLADRIVLCRVERGSQFTAPSSRQVQLLAILAQHESRLAELLAESSIRIAAAPTALTRASWVRNISICLHRRVGDGAVPAPRAAASAFASCRERQNDDGQKKHGQ